MSESFMLPKGSRMSFELETTEGTAATDDAKSSVLAEIGTSLRGIGVNWVERQYMAGHIGNYRPLNGGLPDDLGYDLVYHAKASGTHGTAPEIGKHLECSFGVKSVGVAGTIAASPAATTTGCTLTDATVAPGHLIDLPIGATFETRRVLTESSGAITWWPPTSAAPTSAATAYPGVAYLITSANASMKSGTARFYHQNQEIDTFTGCKGNVVFTLQIRQPMLMEFAMNGINYPLPAQAAIDYTWAPPDFLVVPQTCLSVYLRAYIPCEVAGGASTTSVPLRNIDNSTSFFEAQNAVDKLIVNTGTAYETKTIATWTYSTQTATVTALTGAPAEGAAAYIERLICIPDTIKIDTGHTFERQECMGATYGWSGQGFVNRLPMIDWSRYFKSHEDRRLMANAAFVDFWAILGSTRGNKIALNIPNVFRQDYSLDLGGTYGMISMTGGGYTQSVAGNDEIFLTFL
jgi:hypothetical protein